MSPLALNFLTAALLTLGLFFLVGGLLGRVRLPRPGEYLSLLAQDDEGPTRLPLPARLAQSLSEALPAPRFGLEGRPLEERMLQAGLPYDTPAQFYQRKFAYTLLFAAVAATLAVLLGAGLPLALLATLVAGGFGLFAPESEVGERIRARRDQLRREMAFMLDRVAFALMAYGTFQETLARLTADPLGRQPAEDARVERFERQRRQAGVGAAFTGLGGGLFAEFLTVLAGELTGGIDRFEEIRATLARRYPLSSEVRAFLDVVEGGLRGAPMADRLFELAESLTDELAQEQREAGARATVVVVAAAGVVLVPLLLVVGGPAFTLALSVFGG
jgi:hypothetical protein